MDPGTILALILVGVIVSGGAVFMGFKARYVSHQFNIRKDARFVILLITEFTVLMAASALLGEDAWGLLMLLTVLFDVFYVTGYRLNDPGDHIYLDLHNEDLDSGPDWVGPVVYFYNKYGEQCIMHPTLKASFRHLLGVTDMLEMDLSEVRRSRPVYIWSGRKYRLYHVSDAWDRRPEDLAPVGRIKFGRKKITLDDGSVHYYQRHLFTFPRGSKKIEFCDAAIQEPRSYRVQTPIYVDAIREAAVMNKEIIRLEVQLEEAQFEAGGEIVKGLVSKKLDMDDTRDKILERIDALREERRRRPADVSAEERR